MYRLLENLGSYQDYSHALSIPFFCPFVKNLLADHHPFPQDFPVTNKAISKHHKYNLPAWGVQEENAGGK